MSEEERAEEPAAPATADQISVRVVNQVRAALGKEWCPFFCLFTVRV